MSIKFSYKILSLFVIIILLYTGLSASEPEKESAAGDYLQQQIILKKGTDKYSLGTYLFYLEDKKGQWSVHDVKKSPLFEKFTRSDVEIPNFGFTNSVYWLKCTLLFPEQPSYEKKWFLEMAYPLIDNIVLYIPQAKDKFTIIKGGDRIPFNNRPIKYHNIIFPVKTFSDRPITLYFRVKSQGSVQIPIILLSSETFIEKINKELYILGIYYGMMLV
ncbi:7TM-DISM domain-containing protein, partial [Desulfobacterales bacterium HSG17]|nr:7TM-DISM domain-containing protein [Desulfobacterales bacterium HSG17]